MRPRRGASILGCRWPSRSSALGCRARRRGVSAAWRAGGASWTRSAFSEGGSTELGGGSTRRRNVCPSPDGNWRASPAAEARTRRGSVAPAPVRAAARPPGTTYLCRAHEQDEQAEEHTSAVQLQASQATPAGAASRTGVASGNASAGSAVEHDLERVRLCGGREDVVRRLRVGEREAVRRERGRVEPAAPRSASAAAAWSWCRRARS